MITWHGVYDVATGVVTCASIAYSALPTVESFAAYPRFQKAYAFGMIFIVRLASLNVRSLLYPAIQSTANVGKTSTAVQTAKGGTNDVSTDVSAKTGEGDS